MSVWVCVYVSEYKCTNQVESQKVRGRREERQDRGEGKETEKKKEMRDRGGKEGGKRETRRQGRGEGAVGVEKEGKRLGDDRQG